MKNDEQEKLQRLKMLSELMDSKFEGPLGIRFGLDGLVGLIPFVGDIVTSIVSFSILVSAAQLGATPSTLMRMAGNILVENLIDIIPFFGNLFDFWWQSNNRNLRILEQQLENPEIVSVSSRIIVLTVIFILFLTLFLFIYLSWMILHLFLGLLS
jgi:hypothetical protein